MDNKLIFKFCKDLGCCDSCCLRYLGIKLPIAYGNSHQYALNFQDEPTTQGNGHSDSDAVCNDDEPPSKRVRLDVCVSCLGVLQRDSWPEQCGMVKEMLDKKKYDSKTFACALSAPIATMIRERAITLRIQEAFPEYDKDSMTSLKEAWKWSFGPHLASHVDMTLDSGATCPLLITLNMEYPDEMQEAEILTSLSPALFSARNKQRRRFTVEFTRAAAGQALDGVSLATWREMEGWHTVPSAGSGARCVSVLAVRSPLYLGGRYVKLSRALPQSPWLVDGKRMMHSSVQEIIFEPIAACYQLSSEDVEHRLKFLSAGREDVDVRCLGEGRPFAIEISDPRRELSTEELRGVCEDISSEGRVIVSNLVYVTKEELTQLKKGEETKCKTYEALCVKLSRRDGNAPSPSPVSPEDITNINITPTPCSILQRTPIRVVHRRALLTREREVLSVHAEVVPEHPCLFKLRIRTTAGTYVKEWVHGDFGRTKPSLKHFMKANTDVSVDILALDVASVELDWPKTT